MATKPKDVASRREKRNPSPSTPQQPNTSHGRTIKSTTAASPVKDSSSLHGKTASHSIKPRASPQPEPNKPIKRPTPSSPTTATSATSPAATTKSLTRKKSFDKPPSPSHTHRTPTSSSPKERGLKTSSATPKATISPKTVPDKASKSTPRNGRVQPSVRSKSIKMEASHKKRESKDSPVTNGATASSHDTTDKSTNAPKEGENKPVDEIETSTMKSEEEESIHEIQTIDHVEREKDYSHVEQESDNNEIEDHHVISLPSEEYEERLEEGNNENCSSQDDYYEEEERLSDKDHQEDEQLQPQEYAAAEQIDTKKEENHDNDDAKVNNSGEEHKEEGESVEIDKLEIKDYGVDIGDTKEAKVQSEEAVSKQHDSQQKKDAPAYNEVIEEAANKLIKRQNSKVKALVGAFETVISLQDPAGQGGHSSNSTNDS